MLGPSLLARFLTIPAKTNQWGVAWQYHSQSDRHSKVASWGVAVDLMQTSALMRAHAEAGKIILGVNHEMRDYATGRKKDLDLVIARPAADIVTSGETLASLAIRYKIPLTPQEQQLIDDLPSLPVGSVGAVLVALEAKACMTAHVKSLPRLYDELSSSHACVHGSSRQALAIGYVQVNSSPTFISSVSNPRDTVLKSPFVKVHEQPSDLQRVLSKVAELPRRSNLTDQGFDGIGVTVLNFPNDGHTPVVIDDSPPAPQPGDQYRYESMIVRSANEYDTRFAHT